MSESIPVYQQHYGKKLGLSEVLRGILDSTNPCMNGGGRLSESFALSEIQIGWMDARFIEIPICVSFVNHFANGFIIACTAIELFTIYTCISQFLISIYISRQ